MFHWHLLQTCFSFRFLALSFCPSIRLCEHLEVDPDKLPTDIPKQFGRKQFAWKTPRINSKRSSIMKNHQRSNEKEQYNNIQKINNIFQEKRKKQRPKSQLSFEMWFWTMGFSPGQSLGASAWCRSLAMGPANTHYYDTKEFGEVNRWRATGKDNGAWSYRKIPIPSLFSSSLPFFLLPSLLGWRSSLGWSALLFPSFLLFPFFWWRSWYLCLN